MTQPFIESLLDTDKYKLTMGQAVYHQYPEVGAGYQFINRGNTQFPEGFGRRLQEQVNSMAHIKLQPEEKQFLRESCPELTTEYLDYLADYHFKPGEVTIDQQGGDLKINVDGPWSSTIMWEVPLMATISEQFYQEKGVKPDPDYQSLAVSKAKIFHDHAASYAEFGTRRRFSREIQTEVVAALKANSGPEFIGTSNVKLAADLNLKPVGTYAHEWVMAQAGIHGVENANAQAMDLWHQEFDGRLNCALTDTFTTTDFLENYTPDRAGEFPVLRQDSGSPEAWTDQVVGHIRTTLDRDPSGFTALYSDSLCPDRVVGLQQYAQKQGIKSMFGIGTNLSNDVGAEPLNMVIKMTYVTRPEAPHIRIPVAKISDDPGKTSGHPEAVSSFLKKLSL